MFYKFNQITQNISAATQEVAMFQPTSQKAISTPEPIQYEYATHQPQSAPKPKPSGQAAYPVPNNPRYRKLMDMQTKFTIQDGLLVWQKMPKDLPLYYTTIAMVTAGFGLTVYSLFKLATPPKNE